MFPSPVPAILDSGHMTQSREQRLFKMADRRKLKRLRDEFDQFTDNSRQFLKKYGQENIKRCVIFHW